MGNICHIYERSFFLIYCPKINAIYTVLALIMQRTGLTLLGVEKISNSQVAPPK